uniref:Venom polypeptide n=1 Tax=Dolopus genitalis TaxID=2488630 RepID=A0A3G5BIC8_DOLGE|nr:venom polypeptide [Dolopus genitalis]
MKFLLISFAIVLLVLGSSSAKKADCKSCKVPKIHSPICAAKSDGTKVTLVNKYFLDCANLCGKNLKFIADGKCSK